MAQLRNYATKKKGKTEVYPFWNLIDMKNLSEWFENNNEWDAYLISWLEALLGRRISDTIDMRWSDLYYENGGRREEVTTIEERKTGKTLEIPITSMLFEIVDKYCEKTGINPMEHYNEYIFMTKSKAAWIERESDNVYKETELEKICTILNKDYSDKRKSDIIEDYNKKKKHYDSFGEYFYYEVEGSDINKWQTDSYRKVFNKAVNGCKIAYRVSTHSFRKSFGYWIFKLHPYDPDVLLSLQKMFGHATVEQTEDYIGLTKEKNRKFVDALGNLYKSVLDGNEIDVAKNMPVISLKREDIGNIIMEIILKAKSGEMSDMEIYNMAMNMCDKMAV